MAHIRCLLSCHFSNTQNVENQPYSLPCDVDTLCAIGGGIAEEFYHGTGLDEDGFLQRYLDECLYQIAKN